MSNRTESGSQRKAIAYVHQRRKLSISEVSPRSRLRLGFFLSVSLDVSVFNTLEFSRRLLYYRKDFDQWIQLGFGIAVECTSCIEIQDERVEI